MKFFYAPGTVSLATLIALYETNATFEPIRVDFANKEQTKPEYLSINPKGRVPALATDQGILTETSALLIYIAEQFPDANLLPNDTYTRAKTHEMLSYLASTVHVNHAHKLRGYRWASEQSSFDDMRAKVTDNVFNSFQVIEEALDGPWAMGEHYTISDAHLYTIAGWLEADGVPRTNLPRVNAHFERMNTRPAVRKALELME